MSKSATLQIYYPGACISCNHYRDRTRDGGEYVRAEAKAWMDALGWMIKTHHIEDWRLPLKVTCSGRFKNHASTPDLSNLSKCTLDAIQEATGINDRNMRWHDGDMTFDKDAEPELTIKIEEAFIVDGKIIDRKADTPVTEALCESGQPC